MTPTESFQRARDALLDNANDLERARSAFRWPAFEGGSFNWAWDCTGDEARRDADGYIHFVGRGDDVFKSSDYRISPFELESVLVEQEQVAEAAIVPSPDPLRLSVPKAFVVLTPGTEPSKEIAKAIFDFCNAKLAPYKRIRRLEFAALPKTISGKIRRVELRKNEEARRAKGERSASEYWLEEM